MFEIKGQYNTASAKLILVPIQNITALFCDEDILK